ncbi:MAG: HU family DNA-binding protein [Acidithiobacillus sp.]
MSESVEIVNKTDLAEVLVSTNCAGSKKLGAAIVDTLFGHIAAVTHSGKKVRIHGFGTFSVKHKPAHEARNPSTGESVQVPAKDVLVFKASK